MSDKKESKTKTWIKKYVLRRDLALLVVGAIIVLPFTDIYDTIRDYFNSPEIKVAYSFWGKKAYTEHTSDSTSIVTYIRDDIEDCIPFSMKVKAPRNTISSNLRPAHYAGFIVSNVGNDRANNIDIFFNLEFPGDSFSLKRTYSTRATISITETPIIGQKGQLVEIDHIDPGTYEIVVVGRIDSTSSGNYEGESDKNTFSFYSLNYDEINEPIRKGESISFYQIRRALKSKSYSSRMKTISAPFETHNPDGKTDVSTINGVVNTCVKSLPDTPWYKKDGWLF